MLIFVTLPKLGTKKPMVWVNGLLPDMPRTPMHHLLPSTTVKPTPLSNAPGRASPLLSNRTRAMELAIFAVRKDIGPTNVQTRLASQQSLIWHCKAQLTFFRIFIMSWTQKFMWELWTPPRRMRRTASNQRRLELYSSNRQRVYHACIWMYLSLVLHVHTRLVVYYPLDSNAH